jgi:hypothetical protein
MFKTARVLFTDVEPTDAVDFYEPQPCDVETKALDFLQEKINVRLSQYPTTLEVKQKQYMFLTFCRRTDA